jgi:kynurenine formamidase
LDANELLIISVRCNDKGRYRKETGSYSRLFKLISGLLEDALTKSACTKFCMPYPKEMLLPLVVIDVHGEAAKNPDYPLSLDRVKKWEKDHGQIPAGAFVAMRTEWSNRWPNAAKMENKDANGVAHYPGWSLPALKYLYEDRKITASGYETTDTDPGFAASKDDYSLETYILSTNHYQIELLTNLDQAPEAGALVVVSFPKPKGGSGFPARVFAIVP